MDNERQWPIDMDAARKGDTVPVQLLVRFLGIPFDDKEYQLKLHELAAAMEREFSSRGNPIVVSCEEGSLILHTDASALEYTRREYAAGFRRAFKNHQRLLNIDTGKLDAKERAEHDRRVVVQGAMLVGAMRGYKDVVGLPYKRKTPGLESYRGPGE